MHVVYHETLNPKIVPTDEFHSLLLSGEWFDRPQTNLKGNSDERERLLDEQKIRKQESRPRQTLRVRSDSTSGFRCGSNGSKNDEDGAGASSPESYHDTGLIKKKRGRPKRI